MENTKNQDTHVFTGNPSEYDSRTPVSEQLELEEQDQEESSEEEEKV